MVRRRLTGERARAREGRDVDVISDGEGPGRAGHTTSNQHVNAPMLAPKPVNTA